MGPYQGGQAQYLRVPYADFKCLPLPSGSAHESDFILLADIFPTGWHGVVLSGFQPGESIAIFGAGPVGLMAAYSATLRGASKVFVVDSVKERLHAAGKINCVSSTSPLPPALTQALSQKLNPLLTTKSNRFQSISPK
jgi:threonine dehydrogenase-like Zn-dependent dehydrogenase